MRKADPYFSDIPGKKADADLLEVATALIDKKTDKFDAKVFKDHYQTALRELIARKLKNKGRKITATDEPAESKPTKSTTEDEPPEEKPGKSNVIDLMSALKSSLEGGKKQPAKAPRKKASAKTARKKAS